MNSENSILTTYQAHRAFNRSTLYHLSQLFSKGISQEHERDKSRIHISEITSCGRKLYWNLQEPDVKLQDTTMPLIIGSALHNLIEALIQQLSDCNIEVPVTYLPDYPVIGNADIVDANSVIDLKFLGDWGFQKYLEHGNQAYKLQVLLYAYKLKKPFGIVFAVNRGNLQYKSNLYIVKEHLNEIESYLKRAETIFHQVTTPEKDHDTSDNLECNWCPFKERCWS
jgi:CRISPR/Cas system-associated exonuclease Cas4 (RecB family)